MIKAISLVSWSAIRSSARQLTAINILIVLLTIGYALAFLVVVGIRLFFPYELEWIEGVSIDQIGWIVEGHFPYVTPTINFLPMGYNPLFFYISAGMAKIVGLGFFAPRLLSIAATVGCLILLYQIVVNETDHPVAGILALGIYAASYRLTGTWMDLAKVDSLFLFFLLAAFFLSQKFQKLPGLVASGILYVLAYFTKQLALPIIMVMTLVSLVIYKGRTWPQWVTTYVLSLGLFFSLDWISQGWYSSSSFRMIGYHARLSDWLLFWKLFLPRMWPSVFLALLFVIPTIFQTRFRKWEWPESKWNILGFALALIFASWGVYQQAGTYDNGLMPACLGAALLAGAGFGQLLDQKNINFKFPGGSQIPSTLVIGVMALLICTQFALLYYNPLAQLPTQAERSSGQALVDRVRNLPGEVLLFETGYVNRMAGKTPYLNSNALFSVLSSTPPKGTDAYQRRKKVEQLVKQAVSGQVFDWIIVYDPQTSWLPYYLYTENPLAGYEAYHPTTGTTMVHKSLMVKNPIVRGGALPLSSSTFDSLFVNGWSSPQSWGRWAMGESATVLIALERQHPYTIAVSFHPVCKEEYPQARSISAVWNEIEIDRKEFGSCNNIEWSFLIPRNKVKKLNYLQFVFDMLGREITENENQASFTSFVIHREK